MYYCHLCLFKHPLSFSENQFSRLSEYWILIRQLHDWDHVQGSVTLGNTTTPWPSSLPHLYFLLRSAQCGSMIPQVCRPRGLTFHRARIICDWGISRFPSLSLDISGLSNSLGGGSQEMSEAGSSWYWGRQESASPTHRSPQLRAMSVSISLTEAYGKGFGPGLS